MPKASGVMPAAFQQFQHEFGRYLRDPHHVPLPAGLPARQAGIYRELVFNNLCGFVDTCFPVCRNLLGEPRWRRLCRTFLRDWPLHTPWFRHISREFVRYLDDADIRQPLPRWLAELAHYEWAELSVDVSDTPLPPCDLAGDLLERPVVLNPALMNLAYNWPVQRIGPDYRPRKPQPTHLVVYRDADDRVRFTEVTPVTGRLIDLFANEALSGRQAILRLAVEMKHPDPGHWLCFGANLLADFRQQGIILGSQP